MAVYEKLKIPLINKLNPFLVKSFSSLPRPAAERTNISKPKTRTKPKSSSMLISEEQNKNLDKDPTQNKKMDISVPSSSFALIKDVPMSLIRSKNLEKFAFKYLMSPYSLHKAINTPSGEEREERSDLSSLKKKKTLEEKLRFLKEKEKRKIPINVELIDHFLEKALVKPELAQEFLTDFDGRESEIDLTENHYHLWAKAFRKKGDLKGIDSVVNKMRSRGVPVTKEIYCEKINLLVSNGDTKKAWECYNRMRSDGIAQSEETLECVLGVCKKDRNAPRAFYLFEKYLQDGNPPTLALFNSCMDACASSKALNKSGITKAFQLFKRLQVEKFVPDVSSYNSLLIACSNAKDLNMALRVVKLMDKSGVKKDVFTYIRMIRCISATVNKTNYTFDGKIYSKNERVQMALQLQKELTNSGLKLYEHYKMKAQMEILFIYTNSCFLHRARKHIEQMVKDFKGEKYLQKVYEIGFKMELKCKKVNNCLHYLKEMDSNSQIEPKDTKKLIRLLGNGNAEEKVALEIIKNLKRIESTKTNLNDSEIKFAKKEMTPKEMLIYDSKLVKKIRWLGQLQKSEEGILLPKKRRDRVKFLKRHGVNN